MTAPTNAPVNTLVTILLTAGEASGDRLGAGLIRALQRLLPGQAFRFVGVGGREMAACGLESLFDMTELSVLGLFEGVRALPRINRRADDVANLARTSAPQVAVLIDSWGFSLRVAQRLRKIRAPVHIVKYVGPQIWASRPGRARTLAGAVDHLLSTQSMDAPFYAPLGLPVTFVGNPALTLDVSQADGARARRQLGLSPDQPMLMVLPGSRPSEIARLAEPFGDAAVRLLNSHPDLAVVVPVANTVADQVKVAIAKWSVPVHVIEDDAGKLDAMAGCTVALAASGTVTTELALCGAPMVVGYRVGDMTYAILKRLMRAKFITLLNIAAGREVVPEFLQSRCTGEALATAIEPLLSSPELRGAQIADQTRGLDLMGRDIADPSERAAQAIITDLKRLGILAV